MLPPHISTPRARKSGADLSLPQHEKCLSQGAAHRLSHAAILHKRDVLALAQAGFIPPFPVSSGMNRACHTFHCWRCYWRRSHRRQKSGHVVSLPAGLMTEGHSQAIVQKRVLLLLAAFRPVNVSVTLCHFIGFSETTPSPRSAANREPLDVQIIRKSAILQINTRGFIISSILQCTILRCVLSQPARSASSHNRFWSASHNPR